MRARNPTMRAADPRLYDALERAHTRARQHREGFLRGATTRERQAWIAEAAALLEALGRELRARLPEEPYEDFVRRHGELRRRRAD
jgi:hypothetical protein